jgi:UDP-3-O-[3-hydroxymyristoyl] glucosamine N-acyltransferase
MHRLSAVLRDLQIDYEHAGGAQVDSFARILPLDLATEDSLVFVGQPGADAINHMRSSLCRVFVIEQTWAHKVRRDLDEIDSAFFLVAEPRLIMARVLRALTPDETWQIGVIHPTAQVDPSAAIHPSVAIGAHSIVGRCEIGEGSRIDRFCIIHDGSVLGRHVIVRDYCTIGGAGFGFVRNDHGGLERIPHIGRTVIEDDVDIFPYTNVDRGTLHETRVSRGTKLDHYVHVGHNATIGEDTVITAQAVICGSAVVGARSWVGVGAVIKEATRVGDEATVGLGAVVVRPVEGGDVVAGVPAKSIRK